MRVWRYDEVEDGLPELAEPDDLTGRRAAFVAAASGKSPVAWLALDDYDGGEAALLFGAPAGEEFRSYVAALLPPAIEEARRLGFASVLAHWRGGWDSAAAVLLDLGFTERAPGLWSLRL